MYPVTREELAGRRKPLAGAIPRGRAESPVGVMPGSPPRSLKGRSRTRSAPGEAERRDRVRPQTRPRGLLPASGGSYASLRLAGSRGAHLPSCCAPRIRRDRSEETVAALTQRLQPEEVTEHVLEECLHDEPQWLGSLRVEPSEFAERDFSRN
jgi:hypothetical protein